MPKSKVKEALEKEKTKEGLPKEAFAIVEDPQDPETWKLPHHTKAIMRALQGRLDIEDRELGPHARCRRCPQPRRLPRGEGPGLRGGHHPGRPAPGQAL